MKPNHVQITYQKIIVLQTVVMSMPVSVLRNMERTLRNPTRVSVIYTFTECALPRSPRILYNVSCVECEKKHRIMPSV